MWNLIMFQQSSDFPANNWFLKNHLVTPSHVETRWQWEGTHCPNAKRLGSRTTLGRLAAVGITKGDEINGFAGTKYHLFVTWVGWFSMSQLVILIDYIIYKEWTNDPQVSSFSSVKARSLNSRVVCCKFFSWYIFFWTEDPWSCCWKVPHGICISAAAIVPIVHGAWAPGPAASWAWKQHRKRCPASTWHHGLGDHCHRSRVPRRLRWLYGEKSMAICCVSSWSVWHDNCGGVETTNQSWCNHPNLPGE